MGAVFSIGDRFNTMAETGFFVPALRVAFYTAGKCGAKRAALISCKNRETILIFDFFRVGAGFLRRFTDTL
jgi:hypothetical protein